MTDPRRQELPEPERPQRRRARGVRGLAAASAVVAMLLAAPAARATFPGRNGLLAVSGGSLELGCRHVTINLLRADGSGVRRLTPSGSCATGRSERWGPDWSADGRHLLYLDFSRAGLGVMDADGIDLGHWNVGPQGIAHYDTGELPSFSPSGRQATITVEDSGPRDLRVVSGDAPPRSVGSGSSPRWSPDGRTIAYVTDSLNPRLGLLDVSTGRTTRRRVPGTIESIDWSPDGRRLLLVISPDRGRDWLGTIAVRHPSRPPSRIQLPRAFGSRLSFEHAVWSPDGRRVAFTAYRFYPDINVDGDVIGHIRSALWVMRADGRGLRRITRFGAKDYDTSIPNSVSWQPVVP